MKKVAIIGAGASGLACAIMIKQDNPSVDITVFEACDRVGKKLAMTGNGRCNITNLYLEKNRFHGDSEFAFKVISSFGFEAQKEFFKSIGLPIVAEEDGKAYPMSLQASSVVDLLRFKLSDLGIILNLNSRVDRITKVNDGYTLHCNGQEHFYSVIIIATGGKSYIKSGTESYTLLKNLGHKIEPLFPSIVQIKTETETVKQLKGIKIQGSVTIDTESQKRTEYGEILFCDYGLSGPPVLQVSRLAQSKDAVIIIDVFPQFSKAELINIIKSRIKMFGSRPASELFTGLINKRLGQVILKKAGCNINAPCNLITDNQVDKSAGIIKNLKFKVTETAGFENAQVTAGGAQTTQFFENLMSKKNKGVFATGEVLNVDGDCGGFNLAFAWASAKVAANGVLEYLDKGN